MLRLFHLNILFHIYQENINYYLYLNLVIKKYLSKYSFYYISKAIKEKNIYF